MPVIEAEHLRKVYHAPRGRAIEAVREATFDVEAGEIFGILGPNGAGKTTLLRMLGTIIEPTSGVCRVAGMRADEDAHEVRRHIGFLSGNTKLYGRLTVREVLRYFGRLYSLGDDRIRNRTAELADLLELHAILDQRCDALSTGQTQRANIARVLLHDPPVLILDEPTQGLDIVSSRTILDFIQGARERGRCIVFSTHYMTEAERLCDRIALIDHGVILALGTQRELLERTSSANLQDAFLTLVDRRQGLAS